MHILHLLPLLFFAIHESDTFVTQLQKCGRYHGNFSVRHTDKYFKGTIGETVKNVTRRECSLHCTLYFGCLFFNHKMDGTLCELITSFKGGKIPQPGWQIVSTSLEKVHLRGPLCRYIGGNACSTADDVFTHCEDTCEAPGFKCAKDTNIAIGKTAKASSVFSGGRGNTRDARFAIDGDIETFWAPTSGNDQWLLVDLGEQRFLAYFWWKQLTKKPNNVKEHYGKMKPMRIRIGDHDESNVNGNKVCIENVDHTESAWLGYWCTNGPMYGRYVVLQKGTTSKNERFFVNEIQIYALD